MGTARSGHGEKASSNRRPETVDHNRERDRVSDQCCTSMARQRATVLIYVYIPYRSQGIRLVPNVDLGGFRTRIRVVLQYGNQISKQL